MHFLRVALLLEQWQQSNISGSDFCAILWKKFSYLTWIRSAWDCFKLWDHRKLRAESKRLNNLQSAFMPCFWKCTWNMITSLCDKNEEPSNCRSVKRTSRTMWERSWNVFFTLYRFFESLRYILYVMMFLLDFPMKKAQFASSSNGSFAVMCISQLGRFLQCAGKKHSTMYLDDGHYYHTVRHAVLVTPKT